MAAPSACERRLLLLLLLLAQLTAFFAPAEARTSIAGATETRFRPKGSSSSPPGKPPSAIEVSARTLLFVEVVVAGGVSAIIFFRLSLVRVVLVVVAFAFAAVTASVFVAWRVYSSSASGGGRRSSPLGGERVF